MAQVTKGVIVDRTGGFYGTISSRDAVATAGQTVLRLSGEHDSFTVGALSEAIAQAMAASDGDLVLDLRDVEFMAVATVRVLLHAHQQLRQQSRAVVLQSPPACARRVLDLCGVAALFQPSPVAIGGP